MKKTITTFMLMAACACSIQLFAADEAKDTLILNDGKIVTGTIEKKSLEVYNNMQVNLNTGNTFIDETPGAKGTKISNKDIHYFIIGGTKYANVEMNGGHKIMEVISEGKINLYYWKGEAGIQHTEVTHQTNNLDPRDPNYNRAANNGTTYKTTETLHGLEMFVMMVKGKAYNPRGKYLQKHFEEFFGDCAKLVQESKAANYDFTQITPIVREYNACN